MICFLLGVVLITTSNDTSYHTRHLVQKRNNYSPHNGLAITSAQISLEQGDALRPGRYPHNQQICAITL